jgi:hypothetical protein
MAARAQQAERIRRVGMYVNLAETVADVHTGIKELLVISTISMICATVAWLDGSIPFVFLFSTLAGLSGFAVLVQF